MSKKPGFYIVLEGIECCGKSSVLMALQHALHERGLSVVSTKEPGGTELGKIVRQIVLHRTFELDPRAELLLYAADRAQHRTSVIAPALERGHIVLSDRSSDSAVAYQGYGRGLDVDLIKQINAFAMQGLEPDLAIYLRIDYPTLSARLAARKTGADVIESEQQSFFERIIHGFDIMYKERPNAVIIDATQPLDVVIVQSIDAIIKRIS